MAEDFSRILENFKKETEALAAEAIRALKRERDNLKSELEFLRAENQNARLVLSENEKLNREKIWTQNHLEKLLKKLQSLHV